jgi:nucleotide-binding universal stress UspA family protein
VAPVHRVAAELVSQVAESPQVTLLSVADRDHRAQAEEFLSVLTPLFHARPTGRVVVAEDPLRPILEAATGHDLIVMGAPESSSRTDVVFNPVVDDIARMAPCPTLIVTGRDLHRVRWPAGRILVPTNGRAAARKAAQLAFTLAGEAEVIILHVVPDTVHARVGAPEVARRRRMLEAEEIVGDLRKLAEAYGVKSRADVRVSTSAGDSILAAAGEYGTDLVVLGTELRPGSTRLHLGPQVEIVLQRAPCPVLVLNTQ